MSTKYQVSFYTEVIVDIFRKW